jgi:quercetin dioxygenase-like cupin family protein
VIRVTMTVTIACALLLLAGCAQPGQLGHPAVTPAPVATPVPAPDPGLDESGLVEEPVSVRTPGPAVFAVRTITMAPGQSTGWLRRPGTETSIVRSGTVTLVTSRDCGGTRFTSGDAVFVPDARPQLMRNTGTVPAELVVTTLLAPGMPDRQAVASPCVAPTDRASR